ncbi:ArnT family glycosyltransferase [Halobaculum gomorrense]|uniref:Dolichyl-phosphate-mannose-protein mannosyltransferase n=1 Tax=Halobaculum gomorrense TaxID=43928 RepID=A0A1M5UZ86_9EURY|nr:glycosyltransferase family 39 protein [Halobaculum gomorrense]SHH68312.1 Dolichyl-phosphate-mannose-protein mannosyltransferase [Halobaculum gomorrense]
MRFRFSADEIPETAASVSALGITWVFVYILGLGSFPLLSWDEGIYAYIAEHGVRHGQWIVPTGLWHGRVGPFLQKPPLGFWIQEATIIGFDHSIVAVRLPSAIGVLGIAIATYGFVRTEWDEVTGILAGFCFLITPHVFAGQNAGRSAAIDIPFVFFGTLFVYLSWRALHGQERLLLPASVAISLAILTKGFAAGIYAVILLPVVLLHWRQLSNRTTVYGLLISFICIVPWPVYMYVKFGQEFLQQIFFSQVLGRVSDAGYTAQNGIFEFMNYPYFKLLPIALDPFIYILPQAVLLGLYRRYQQGQHSLKFYFLVWWATSVPLFFALTGNHDHYLLPMYPATAVLSACLLKRALGGDYLAYGSLILGVIGISLFSYRVPGFIISMVDIGFEVRELETIVLGGTVPSGIGYLAAIAGSIVGVLLIAHIDVTRSMISKYGIQKQRLLGVVFLLLILPGLAAPTPVVSPGAGPDAQWDSQQKLHALALNDRADRDHEVTLQQNLTQTEPLYPFAFYAEPDITVATPAEIQSQYALIITSDRSELTRPYQIQLQTTNRNHANLTLVRFTDQP